MYLKINKKTIIETVTKVDFEKVADGLLMISICNDVDDQSKIFCYWRLMGSGTNPPLEIGINTETKTIKSITFFVDADCFNSFTLSKTDFSQSDFLVNTEIFRKTNDYVDVKGQYSVSLADNKLLCIFDEKYQIKEIFKNGRIEFFLSEMDELVGFAVCSLKEYEMKEILSL